MGRLLRPDELRQADADADGAARAGAPVTTASDVMLSLQQTAGNQAVGASLGRSPARLARQPTVTDDAPGLRTPHEDLLGDAKLLMAELTGFQLRATKEMGRVHENVVAYLKTYRLAHGKVMADLGKAKEEAAARDALLEALTGILVGTGVGLVLPRVIDGFRKLKTVGDLADLTLGKQAFAEAGGEAIEAGAATVTKQTPGRFDLPPELSADLVASEQWQKLAEGWRSLAEVAPVITAFGNARYELLETSTDKKGATQLATLVRKWKEGDTMAQMRAAMAETDSAVAQFVAVLDSPVLRRDELTIGQDLLIVWMLSLATPEDPDRPEYVDPSDLDEIDDAEGVLAKWGLVSGAVGSLPVEQTRLGVDFGGWTSRVDQLDSYKAALAEKQRSDQIGRLGVIVRAFNEWGIVRLQHDVYDIVGRPDPKPGGPEMLLSCSTPDFKALAVGQIVMLAGQRPSIDTYNRTRSPNMIVEPLKKGDVHPGDVVSQFGSPDREPRLVRRPDYGPVPVDDAMLGWVGLDQATARTLPDEVLVSMYGLPPRVQGVPYAPPAPTGPALGPWPVDDGSAPAADEPAGSDEEPLCIAPEEVNTSVSPDDPLLDPDAAALCFGEPPGP